MKELFQGLWALIWAIIVSVLVITIGTIYSFVYSIWLSVTLKKWHACFTFWLRLVDGFCAALGHLFYELAYAMDLCWNVNGEIIEDLITSEENTTFTQKNISVSASTGKLEIDGKLNKTGRIFSKTLNFFFGQKQHAVDAWNYTKARKELKEQYFAPRKQE
jgi:hypothetical protein